MPGFVKNAVDFFTSLPGRIGDFVSWLKEEFQRGWDAVVSFFTKTLPDWLNAAREFMVNLPDKIRKIFLEDLPSAVTSFLKNAWDWLSEHVGKPVVKGLQAIWDTISDAIRGFFRAVIDYYNGLVGAFGVERASRVF